MTAARAAERARQLRNEGRAVRLVTGYFDPLVAEHARKLRDGWVGTTFAVVCEAREPLLAARARAELVAGLRVVDYVVLAGDGGCGSLEAEFAAAEVTHLEDSEEALTRNLVAHVHSRHESV